MKATHLESTGLVLVELAVHRDGRGFFMERFRRDRFLELGLPVDFVQDNHSRSAPGVLRGLHYQNAPTQGKLIGVVRGRIFDVAVDLRTESPTFGRVVTMELSDDNGRMLWVPPGFAHGFCVLGNEPADVVYKVDAKYSAAGEGGIRWDDPELAIAWPLEKPNVSDRDARLPSFAAYKAAPVVWTTASSSCPGRPYVSRELEVSAGVTVPGKRERSTDSGGIAPRTPKLTSWQLAATTAAVVRRGCGTGTARCGRRGRRRCRRLPASRGGSGSSRRCGRR